MHHYDFIDHTPTFGELAVIPCLESQWFTVGMYLQIDPETLDHIKNDSTNLIKKQRQMFKAYLRNNPYASWRMIIKSLQHCKRDDLAKDICEIFQLPNILLMQTSYGSVESKYPGDVQHKEVHWNDKQHRMMDSFHFCLDTTASEVQARQPDCKNHNSHTKSCSMMQKLKQNSADVHLSSSSAPFSPANKQPSLVLADSTDCKHLTPGCMNSGRETNVPAEIQKTPQSKDTFMPHPAVMTDYEDPNGERLDSNSDYQSFSNSSNHSEEEAFHESVVSRLQHTQRLSEQPPKQHDCSKYTSLTSTIQRSRLSSLKESGERERTKHSRHASAPVKLKEPYGLTVTSHGQEQVSIIVAIAHVHITSN